MEISLEVFSKLTTSCNFLHALVLLWCSYDAVRFITSRERQHVLQGKCQGVVIVEGENDNRHQHEHEQYSLNLACTASRHSCYVFATPHFIHS